MDWARDLPGWPLSEHSQRITSTHRWHAQIMGNGSDLLLLHGAGGSTHSWRDLIPDLARDHRVIALDLPGHGFTQLGNRRRSSLPTMSADIDALIVHQGWHPKAIVAHSAGTAIALHLAQHHLSPRGQAPKIIGINPALSAFEGLAGWLFPALAKMLAAAPFTASLFTLTSDPLARAQRLISGTGSDLSPEGYALYAKLIADRGHVDGALQMMAQWDLTQLLRDLPLIQAPCLFLTGAKDKAVPPKTAISAAERLSDAHVMPLDGLGHLLHEEAPEQALGLIRDYLAD